MNTSMVQTIFAAWYDTLSEILSSNMGPILLISAALFALILIVCYFGRLFLGWNNKY